VVESPSERSRGDTPLHVSEHELVTMPSERAMPRAATALWPTTKRGVVLMDPSYEGHRDYSRVVASLRDALTRFVDGVYMVWYPQVSKLEAAQLPKRLEALAPKGWLHARLTVQEPDAQGFGLAGSGVFVLHPPHTLRAALAEVLPYLVDALGQSKDAGFLLDGVAP